MEPLHIANATFGNIYTFFTHYPIYAALSSVLFFVFLVRFYARLTLGMYTDNVNMQGKTVVITGGNAGIGKATALELAKNGARVILACRSQVRGQRAVDEIVAESGNPNVVFRQLDLASFESVRAFTDKFLKEEARLDVLINNAGIVGPPKREVTVDGLELVMQSNHLGHFLLTNRLLDLLKKSAPSRIVNVSSAAYRMLKLDIDDLNSLNDYNSMNAYSSSKSANILFTQELARRLKGTGVVAHALHPGVVKTEILKGSPRGGWYWLSRTILVICGKNAWEGAQTTLFVAMSPKLKNVSGKYFADCKEQLVSPFYFSEERGKKLWQVSEELLRSEKKTN